MLVNPSSENGKDGEKAENDCPHGGNAGNNCPQGGNAGNNCPGSVAEGDNNDEPRKCHRSSFGVGCLVFLSLFSVFASFVAVPNYIRNQNSRCILECIDNEKNIGFALEMYAVDHDNKYPSRLQDLVPEYRKEIPTCPAAHGESYSQSYVCSKTKEAYTFTCKGENHRGVVFGDYPQYNSQEGLIIGK